MERSVVEARQRWVKRHPCRTPDDSAKPGYRADLMIGGQLIGTFLSINLFQNPPVWRASIALIDRMTGKGKNIFTWSHNDKVAALGIAAQLLEGVGQAGHESILAGSMSVDVMRLLTADEALAVAAPPPQPNPLDVPMPVGEFDFYDLTDRRTQIAGWQNRKTGKEEGIYMPQTSEVIYG